MTMPVTLEPQAPITHTQALLEQGLYAPVDVGRDWLKIFRYQGFVFDAYCIHCKQSGPFRVAGANFRGSNDEIDENVLQDGLFDVDAKCMRASHTYCFNFHQSKRSIIQKVGQFPSLEDIAGADIEKYRSQLKGGAFNELRKATGLASHGIGIGAFVYLRRIFERLVEEHRQLLEQRESPIEGFDTMRMEEKIHALRSVLPTAIVKHRGAYGILSKGLHELSEQECKDYFPVVRAAIIQMLEEDWIERERRRNEVELERQLQAIARKLEGGARSAPE
jgi:hypothetical protein